MSDLTRIANALERIAAAMERQSPTPAEISRDYDIKREFDQIAERMFPSGRTISDHGGRWTYKCPFCEDIVTSKMDFHTCREVRP